VLCSREESIEGSVATDLADETDVLLCGAAAAAVERGSGSGGETDIVVVGDPVPVDVGNRLTDPDPGEEDSWAGGIFGVVVAVVVKGASGAPND